MKNEWRQTAEVGMRVGLIWTCLIFAISGQDVLAASELIFAHVADGGGYKTTLLFTNPSSLATTLRISFTDDAGNPLELPSGGVRQSSYNLFLPALGSARLETSGTSGILRIGWARMTAQPDTEIRGNCIFQLYNGTSLFSEASVPAALPSSSMDFFADEENGFHTGFALANPGSTRAVGTITLRRTDGSPAGEIPIHLEPAQHLATYLFQNIKNVASGRAEIQLTEGALAVSALRYHDSSIFSAISVGQPTATLEALFSPGGGVRARLIREIDAARSTIDIAIYSFTLDEIREALINARGRGIAIRIIADTSQIVTSGGEIPTLEQLGFNVKRLSGLGTGIMHNKYLIVDGRLLVTGSYNWSNSAENFNFENALFIANSSVIRRYQENFTALWSR